MRPWLIATVILLVLCLSGTVSAADRQVVHTHTRSAISRLKPVDTVASSTSLDLAIGLPLRNREVLTNFIEQVYNPASPNYHQYLTPEQFAANFGPAEADYQAVIDFATRNGLSVTGTHPNRMIVDVSGTAANIEKAFHVKMRVYRHPKESRTFYAPDVEPSIDLGVPVLDVSGMDNFDTPQPKSLHPLPHNNSLKVTANAGTGSGPSGSLLGNDFRSAYIPGVGLDGSGQTVALFELDGYYAADITSYVNLAGLSSVPLQNVLVDGATGNPTSANGIAEVSLDIEMAIAMAPKLSKIYVYEGPAKRTTLANINDTLNRIATDNLTKQISSSWGWGGGTNSTTDQIFLQYVAQGQSFYEASGDSGAYSGTIQPPSDDPYITVVGGTTLTTSGPNGSWVSEKVWSWFPSSKSASSGGISTIFAIPTWQQGVSMANNQGSTTMRNLPDVALTADNIWVIYNNGSTGAFGGTSCAAPLWASLTALLNQRNTANGKASVGFVNPAIYQIGTGANFTLDFHDIIVGNNTNSTSPTKFYAVTGYDLCTGWGTPYGTNIIADLTPGTTAFAPSVTWTNPAGIAYGTALSSTQLNANSSISGSYSYNPPAGTVLNVGTNTLSVTFTPYDSFDFIPVTTTAKIVVNPAPLAVTANNASRAYAQSDPTFNGTITGLKNGDNITATYATTAISSSPVGTYPIIPTLVDPNSRLSNYTVSSTNGTLTITKATLTVTGVAANNKPYDGNKTATLNTSSAILNGVLHGDNVSLGSTGSGTFSSANVANSIGVTVTNLTLTGTSAGNYTLTQPTGITANITPVTLTATANNTSRAYGAANPTFTAGYTGFVNSETTNVLSGSPFYSTTADTTSTVGTYTITISQGNLTALNYVFSFVNGTLTVTPTALTVSANSTNRVYGQPNPTFTGNIVGLKNSDPIAANYDTTATTSSPVSAYAIKPSLNDPSGKLPNYTVTTNLGVLNVTKASLSATGLAANGKTYDGTTAATIDVSNASLSGALAGDDVSLTGTATGIFASANVGTNVSVTATNFTLTGTSAGNYTLGTISGLSADITQALLTATANNKSRAYGATNPVFTTSYSGFVNNETTSVLSGSPVLTSSAVTNSPVTTYPITISQGTLNAQNYGFNFVNGTLTVTQAVLTVKADNQSRVYGAPNPTLTASFSGFVNNEDASVISGTPALSTTAGVASTAGNYTIQAGVGTLTAANYSFNPVNGTLSITPAPLSVTANNASRNYGQSNPTFTGSISGLLNNDAITATYSSTATASSAVGTYPIKPSLSDPNGKLSSYTVTTNNGTLTINTTALTVTANDASRAYGQANPTFTGTLAGLQNGDNITATYSTTASASSAVGTYTIKPSLTDPTSKLPNYTVTTNNGTLTINKAMLTVSGLVASNKVYDTTATAGINTNSAALVGIFGSDSVNLTGNASGSFSTANAGNNLTVTVSGLGITGSSSGNYALTSPITVTANIVPASLTVNVNNASRTYGASNPTFTGNVSGLQGSDNITASYVTTATAASAVGNYSITPTLTDSGSKLGNYSVTTNAGTLNITAASLTVTGNNSSKNYGQTNPSFTGTVTGLKNGDNITASFASAATAASSVGTYPITPSLTDPNSKLGNYTVSTNNGTLTINQASLTVAANNTNRVYGVSNPAFSGTITGLQNSDNITANYATSATASSAAGTYPITFTLNDPNVKLPNYLVATNNATLTITLAALTVTANDTSRAYGQSNPTFTGSVNGLQNGDTITANFSTSASTTSPVGGYSITFTLTDLNSKLPNYSVVTNNGTLTINAVALTVTANNASRSYGQANPTFSGSINGLKNGDSISANFTSTAAITSPVGSYNITPVLTDPDAKLPNYAVTTNSGTLTVGQASLIVTANNASRAYGQTNPSFTGSLTGIKNSDNITAGFNTSATLTSPVGSYPIKPTLSDPDTRLPNYSIVTNNGSLSVSKAVLTAQADNLSRSYGATNPVFTASYSGFANNETTSVISGTPLLSSIAATNTPVGNYSITIDTSPLSAANYSFASQSGTLTITQAMLTVTANNALRFFGQTNPVFSGTVVGVQNQENLTASFSSIATQASTPGSYPIVSSLIDPDNLQSNYSVSLVNGELTISPLPSFQSPNAQSNGGFNFQWDALSGFTYQVQYKTNLNQLDWINLGAPITATNSTLILIDANAVDSFLQKFYRIVLVP